MEIKVDIQTIVFAIVVILLVLYIFISYRKESSNTVLPLKKSPVGVKNVPVTKQSPSSEIDNLVKDIESAQLD